MNFIRFILHSSCIFFNLKFWFAVNTENITYQFEEGVDVKGETISCGEYKEREELEKACTDDIKCIGYSTTNRSDLSSKIGDDILEADGFYPLCLKKSEDSKRPDVTHNYYKKNISSKEGNTMIQFLWISFIH